MNNKEKTIKYYYVEYYDHNNKVYDCVADESYLEDEFGSDPSKNRDVILCELLCEIPESVLREIVENPLDTIRTFKEIHNVNII